MNFARRDLRQCEVCTIGRNGDAKGGTKDGIWRKGGASSSWCAGEAVWGVLRLDWQEGDDRIGELRLEPCRCLAGDVAAEEWLHFQIWVQPAP